MIDQYIEDWLTIIENMQNDNTYKLAWGRSIIENVCMIKDIQSKNTITFEMIASKMIKYYWNQTFFFNLKQSANDKKPPILVQNVYALIEEYKKVTASTIPIWFDKAEVMLMRNEDYYTKMIYKSARKLKDDVSWRFKIVNKIDYDLYTLDKENLCIYLSDYQVTKIQDYAVVLSELLNYKWAQLLEKYNTAPKIANKVKGISDNKLKRANLTEYKKLLLKYYDGQAIDFYTGKAINEDEISIDHVIPWSFIYSDDLWNLVMTTKSHNSSKSNSIPPEEVIEKLKKRNEDLAQRLTEEKYKNQMLEAIANNYVDKFYLALKL